MILVIISNHSDGLLTGVVPIKRYWFIEAKCQEGIHSSSTCSFWKHCYDPKWVHTKYTTQKVGDELLWFIPTTNFPFPNVTGGRILRHQENPPEIRRSLHHPWYSDWTARTPRTVLGLSSDYFWLRGLLNIQCESEPVRTESKQSPLDYSESSDSPRTRLRTESKRSPTSLAWIQLNSYFNLKSNYYHDLNPRPLGLMTNKWHY
jgi:hypothetical protein